MRVNQTAGYRVRVRRGDCEVEVEGPDGGYVDAKLKELLDGTGAPSAPVPAASGGPVRRPSLVEHVRALKPRGGTQHVIAVGHYVESVDGRQGFKTRDISEGFKQIRFRHSNPAEAVRQARSQGFLMDGAEAGTMQLTQSALAWVEGQRAATSE